MADARTGRLAGKRCVVTGAAQGMRLGYWKWNRNYQSWNSVYYLIPFDS